MKLVITLFISLLLTQAIGLTRAGGTKFNILYILADDLECGDVHCLNPERCKIATPNLDRLASQACRSPTPTMSPPSSAWKLPTLPPK